MTTRQLHIATIREYARHKDILTDDIETLISQANSDLQCGPAGSDDSYPGFESACAKIGKALRVLGTLWVTHDGCIFDEEPDWETEDPAHYTRFDPPWGKQAIVGAALAPYLLS